MGDRLDGPVPERVRGVQGPVVAETTKRPLWELIVIAVGLYYLVILLPFLIWTGLVELRPDYIIDHLRLLRVLFLLLYIPILVIGYRLVAVQVLASRVVLDTDCLWLMRGEKVVGALRFDGKVTVDVDLPEEGNGLGDVKGFKFGRGLLNFYFVVSPEDTARLWPVVEAAAWKHRMRLGEDIQRLFDGPSDDDVRGR